MLLLLLLLSLICCYCYLEVFNRDWIAWSCFSLLSSTDSSGGRGGEKSVLLFLLLLLLLSFSFFFGFWGPDKVVESRSHQLILLACSVLLLSSMVSGASVIVLETTVGPLTLVETIVGSSSSDLDGWKNSSSGSPTTKRRRVALLNIKCCSNVSPFSKLVLFDFLFYNEAIIATMKRRYRE